jgi:hypothetical protein
MDSTCARGTSVVGGVAALDGSQELGGDALAGGPNGEIIAVITVRDGLVVANPFRSTAAVVDVLKRCRAALLARA